MGPVPGGLRPWRRRGGLKTTALDFVRRCNQPVYLSNAEKEALWLTGYGDAPPWAVQQGLEQALARGSYVPGEEALRLRLADALDLEDRLAAQLAEELADEAEGDEFASNLQQGLLEGIQAPDGNAEDAAVQEVTSDGQEAPGAPSGDEWRSPLEIVQEGALEQELGHPDEEAAVPAPAEVFLSDHDFSSFTKTQLVTFAQEMFGVDLDRRESRDHLIAKVQKLVDEA